MSDNITLASPSLFVFLDRLGLPLAARDRVIEIDRQLSDEIESDTADADRCALLVLEAADLISDRDPTGFDQSEGDGGRDHHRDLKHESGTDPAPRPLCNRF